MVRLHVLYLFALIVVVGDRRFMDGVFEVVRLHA